MFDDGTVRHNLFHSRPQLLQEAPRRGRMSMPVLAAFLLLATICAGCYSQEQATDFQLHLSIPEIQGKTVSVNGGVAAPVERIQWEWGDGQKDRHHFFPASHTYAGPGTYQITVTVFGGGGTSATATTQVAIK